MKFLTALLLAAQCQAADPARPKLSNDFSAMTHVTYEQFSSGRSISGDGQYASNMDAGMFLEVLQIEDHEQHGHLDVWKLRRRDLGKVYERDGGRNCTSLDYVGPAFDPWVWVQDASYVGTRRFGSVTCDVWTDVDMSTNMLNEVAVRSTNPDFPFYTAHLNLTSGDMVKHIYHDWVPGAPEDSVFAVPPDCN